jgi:hypothetical protein
LGRTSGNLVVDNMSNFGSFQPAKRVSVRTGAQLLKLFWPDFVEINGCVFADFQCSGSPIQELSDGKTETESFVNHTHVLDGFENRATSERRDNRSKDLDVVEETYDVNHPDFAYACEVGKQMARIWAMKLKADFPRDRFRVYYIQYDNPIVRFHKVRENEPVWLSDQQLMSATDPSFRSAVVYDTDRIDTPVTKNKILSN